METEDFKPNSNRSKEARNDSNIPEQSERKVITGNASIRKKSELRKFADIFMPDDVASVRDHIVNDVIIPKVKNVISETIDMLLYGSSGGSSRRSTAAKVSYRSYYDDKRTRTREPDEPVQTFSVYEEVELKEYGDACEVMRLLEETVAEYGMVKVSDLYEYAGIKGIKNTHFKYGWMDISKAKIVPYRGKYIIKMPRVMPLG